MLRTNMEVHGAVEHVFRIGNFVSVTVGKAVYRGAVFRLPDALNGGW